MPLGPPPGGGCGAGECELCWALPLLDDVSAASMISWGCCRAAGERVWTTALAQLSSLRSRSGCLCRGVEAGRIAWVSA